MKSVPRSDSPWGVMWMVGGCHCVSLRVILEEMKCPLLSLTLLILLFPLFAADAENVSPKKRMTVVIDAGHGGKDPGAIGSSLKLKEKDVNLAVALELGRLLYAEPGFRVIFTRKTDVFIPLDERAQKANKEKADLFISIHSNATPNRSTYGTETYVVGASSKENMAVAMRENASILYEENYKARYGGFDPNKSESYIMFDMMQSSFLSQSIDLAQRVQKQFVASCKRTDRSVKQAGFLVLKQTNMPSVLVELGYLSNPKEEKYLKKNSSRKALAKAIFEAVLKYRSGYESKNASVEADLPPEPPKSRQHSQPAGQEGADGDAGRGDSTSAKGKSGGKTPVGDAPELSAQKISQVDSVCYRIQFCTSRTRYSANAKEFKSCVPAYEYPEGGLYKYMYGKVSTFSEAVELQRRVRREFKDAFVVVMRGKDKLPAAEASQYLK